MRRVYRVNDSSLPGQPDISLQRQKIAIFVHGCFWHQHHCKRGARVPKSNKDYWLPKLHRNVTRDKRVRRELHKLGWRSLVIWECQLREPNQLKTKLTSLIRPQ
jgi:DNA mismatch endonuclease (patch repair protein)